MPTRERLRLKVLQHASQQLDALVARPLHPSCADTSNLAAVIRQEALIARHARDFGMLPMLQLEPDATEYEISYAVRRYFERPGRPRSALRIRDLIGVRLARTG